MLKYSSNKKTVLTASILFGFTLGAITYIGWHGPSPDIAEFNNIYEGTVNPASIFFNNIALALSNIALAFPTFGLYPLATMLTNITTLGLLVKHLIESEQQILILKLVPHGIIELFGLAFSVALVLVLTANVAKSAPHVIKGEEEVKTFCLRHLRYLASGIIVEIIIFLVAACIETAISNIKFL